MTVDSVWEIRWSWPGGGRSGRALATLDSARQIESALTAAGYDPKDITVRVALGRPAGRSLPRDTGRDASYPEDPDDASDRAAYTALGRRAFPRPNPRDVSGGNGTEFS